MDALVSIHDVEPRRMPRVLEILDLLDREGVPPPTLLIVPGVDWKPADLVRLRGLEAAGYELAGHGWGHRAVPPRSWYHRAHALVISRDQAEHLSRSRAELRDLVERCHAWFGDVGLASPELYVPPAWAMGAVTPQDLAELPFTWYETLTGFTAPRLGAGVRTPLVGYEADNPFRKVALRAWNRTSLAVAHAIGRAVRVAIHPDDLHLELGTDLRALLSSRLDFSRTGTWLRALAPPSPAPPAGRLPSARPATPPGR